MAHGRSRKNSSIADAVPSTPLADRLFSVVTRPAPLRGVEDRREYHPLGPVRPAKTLSGHSVKPVQVKKMKKMPRGKTRLFLSPKVQFEAPLKTVICVRRKRRKEVLHALKKTGGGRGRKPPRRNWYSDVSC